LYLHSLQLVSVSCCRRNTVPQASSFVGGTEIPSQAYSSGSMVWPTILPLQLRFAFACLARPLQSQSQFFSAFPDSTCSLHPSALSFFPWHILARDIGVSLISWSSCMSDDPGPTLVILRQSVVSASGKIRCHCHSAHMDLLDSFPQLEASRQAQLHHLVPLPSLSINETAVKLWGPHGVMSSMCFMTAHMWGSRRYSNTHRQLLVLSERVVHGLCHPVDETWFVLSHGGYTGTCSIAFVLSSNLCDGFRPRVPCGSGLPGLKSSTYRSFSGLRIRLISSNTFPTAELPSTPLDIKIGLHFGS